MEIITGFTGAEHVTSADDAALYRGVFGQDDYALDVGNKLEATIIDNNTIKVADGDLVIQGHQGRIRANDYEEVTINNGILGKKRNDLIVARYAKNTDTGVENIELSVNEGTTGDTAQDPSFEVGDIAQGATIREFPLYRVKLDGLSIVAVEKLFNTSKTFAILDNMVDRHLENFTSLLEGGQTYKAILKNAWTGDLYCSKNDLGQVWVRGNIVAGVKTAGTTIASLPAGFEPLETSLGLTVYDGERAISYVGIFIHTDGSILIREPASSQNVAAARINVLFQGVR